MEFLLVQIQRRPFEEIKLLVGTSNDQIQHHIQFNHISIIKKCYIFHQMNKLDELREATKRKKVGLFFIKSRHSRPTFKNHLYFTQQSTQQKKSLERKSHQFVSIPTTYGLENTYTYICEQEKNRRQSQTFQKMKKQPQKLKPKFKLPTEPSHYFKMTQSYLSRSRRFESGQFEKQVPPKYVVKQNPADIIELMFISPKQTLNEKICIDIFPYLIKCFLKCKIKFNKITSSQYEYIKWAINEVRNRPKKYYDIKDIVNMETVNEIFQQLSKHNENSIEWTQIIRYFFVPNEQVFMYQYKKVLDQIKQITIMKFSISIHHIQLYVYRIEDRMKVHSLYDLFYKGSYIFGDSSETMDNYQNIMKKRSNMQTFQNRINRWKSIMPLDHSSSKDRFHTTHSKYDRISMKFKERYEKRKTQRKSQELALITNSFVDRSQFSKEEDIFE